MRTSPILAIYGVTALAVAASACGGSGGSTAQPATSAPAATSPRVPIATATPLPSPVPAPAGFPTGLYSGFLESAHGAPGTLTLNPDGTYRILGASEQLDIAGDYTVSGDGITFLETINANCSIPGQYTWRISGSTLKLSVVKDLCAGGARGNDFAEHPWIKQP